MKSKSYCQIFIQAEIDDLTLLNLVKNFLRGKNYRRNIESQYISLSLIKNENFDQKQMYNPIDGFLYYQYFLETEPPVNVDLEIYVQQLKLLVNFLREKGYRVIPSCGFEEMLNDRKPYTEYMKKKIN